MQLNSDGERLLSQIAPALDSLSDAVEAMTSGIEVLRLRLGILPLYAPQRLFPRLADLRAKHPQLHPDIPTAGHTVERLGEGLEVALAPAREIESQHSPQTTARRRVGEESVGSVRLGSQ